MHRMVLTAASAVALALVAAPAASASPACYSPAGAIAKTCVDTTGSCTVGQYRTTPAGTGYYCLVKRTSRSRNGGPCAIQRSLFEKYNIQIDMHQAQVEGLYAAVCGSTG